MAIAANLRAAVTPLTGSMLLYARKKLPAGMTRDDLVEHFSAQGLPCFQGTCSEIYLEKAFEGMGFRPQDRLPVAQQLGETSLMFLVHPGVKKVKVTLP